MEYILTCFFYLKQIICVNYRIKEEKHIDTIKNYNYNSTSSETDKTTTFQITIHSHPMEK
jgi:hypothetical protein